MHSKKVIHPVSSKRIRKMVLELASSKTAVAPSPLKHAITHSKKKVLTVILRESYCLWDMNMSLFAAQPANVLLYFQPIIIPAQFHTKVTNEKLKSLSNNNLNVSFESKTWIRKSKIWGTF